MPSQIERDHLMNRVFREAERHGIPDEHKYRVAGEIADQIEALGHVSAVEDDMIRHELSKAGTQPTPANGGSGLSSEVNEAAHQLAAADGKRLPDLPPLDRLTYINKARQTGAVSIRVSVGNAEIEAYWGRPIGQVTLTEAWQARRSIESGHHKR